MAERISILGCGWLGLPLGASLAQKGFGLKGSTTSPEKIEQIRDAGIAPYLLHAGVEELEGPEKRSFFESEILILNIPPGGRRRPEVEEEYPRQIQKVLEEVQASPIRQLLFISSTSVYGRQDGLVTEECELQPDTPSGRALATVERLLALLVQPQITILRMSGLVGGSRKAGRFLAGRKDVPGGEAPVNLVHLEDCIGLIEAVIAQKAWGHTLNVCADEHPTRAAFYTSQAQKQGFEAPTFIGSRESSYKTISNQKLKKVLGYRFRHPDPMLF